METRVSGFAFGSISGSPLELCEDWGDPASGIRLRSGIDSGARCVILATSGVWASADVERFAKAQKQINDAARGRYGRLRMLMDLREATVVTQDASARMQALNMELYRTDDRIAIVANSALMAMQLRRAFTIGTKELFRTPQDAIAWLMRE